VRRSAQARKTNFEFKLLWSGAQAQLPGIYVFCCISYCVFKRQVTLFVHCWRFSSVVCCINVCLLAPWIWWDQITQISTHICVCISLVQKRKPGLRRQLFMCVCAYGVIPRPRAAADREETGTHFRHGSFSSLHAAECQQAAQQQLAARAQE
jgi:hypothetical protein